MWAAVSRFTDHMGVEAEDVAEAFWCDNVGWAAFCDYAAILHGNNVVGVAGRKGNIVQHHHYRPPVPAVEDPDEFQDIDLVGEVKIGGGFIQE